jgi:Domain of unknown function (DUF1707)
MPPNSPAPLDPRFVPVIVTDMEREQYVRWLGDHYALDHVSLEEYEFRVQAALRASHGYELAATVSDLPALPDHGLTRSGTDDSARPTSRSIVALMGGVVRKGRWLVPRRLRALAIMGGVEIDLRDADFSPGVTEIWALAIMGGVGITVPPGVRLEVDGLAVMGGFSDQEGLPAVARDDAPVVRVRGLALMGGVGSEMKPRGVDDSD